MRLIGQPHPMTDDLADHKQNRATEDINGTGVMEQIRWMELWPFEHQVGGMTRIFNIDANTICKPCLQRELLFYRTMPAQLLKYTPCFRGIFEIKIVKNADGTSIPLGFPVAWDPQLHDNGKEKRIEGREPVLCLRQKLGRYERSYEQELQHIDAVQKESGQLLYIAFDNIVVTYRRPSILDLKVGLRFYGDDQALDVRDWKMAKYNRTTSSTLGLRNCGMKVYNRNTRTYAARDKYECFKYDVRQFYDSLYDFLHDGVTLRYDVIQRLEQKLRHLRQVVESLAGVRFYSVSLLLVYDELTGVTNIPDVKVNFNGTKNAASETRTPTTDGNISAKSTQDLKNDCHVVGATGNLAFCSQKSASRCDGDSVEKCGSNIADNGIDIGCNVMLDVDKSRATCDSCHLSRINRCQHDYPPCQTSSANRPKVNVKLIDFAHATHSNLPGDLVRHDGHHRGFLYGLDNLIRILNEIRSGTDLCRRSPKS